MNTQFRRGFNSRLDKMVSPEIELSGRSWPAFQVCGIVGLLLALALAATLVYRLDLSFAIMAAIVLCALATFYVLCLAAKLITGEERMIYYHHQIAVLLVVHYLLRGLGQPTLSYLDVTALGIGMFLACGRVGCLMVGCCHGRPHGWGVCYSDEHVAAGFASYLAGVRLFPIQAVESLWAFLIVTFGVLILLSDQAPGEALAWYVLSYCVGRFSFELLRGDRERPGMLGFSEAQWTSVVLLSILVWAELSGILVFHPWHLAVAVWMAIALAAIFLNRRYRGRITYRLLNPGHVKEVAEALERLSGATTRLKETRQESDQNDILLECTPLGIQISSSKIHSAAGCAFLYGLSSRNETITQEEARTMAGLILQLKHPDRSSELIKGNEGIFHLLVHPMSGQKLGHSLKMAVSTK